MNPPQVTIIGGGLAGMVVAHELSKGGVHVTILEMKDRLGGKAGADPNCSDPSRLDDHGYHIFPAWYVNTRALLIEIGMAHHLIPFDHVNFMKPGQHGRAFKLWAPAPRFLWRNITSELLPWYEIVLGMYAALDLATQRFNENAFLDRTSANGFLRSRFYCTEGVSKAHHGFVLQASAIPHYLLSAMTASQLLASYFKSPLPIHAMLDDNLNRRFIEPLRQRLVVDGVRIVQHCVTKLDVADGRVVGLEIDHNSRVSVGPTDIVVLATPPAAAFALVDDDLYRAEEESTAGNDDKRLSDLVNLRSVPMGAWHVYFSKRLPGIPREHTVLHGSRHESSFIDISQHWADLDTTVLSLISSNVSPLRNVSTQEALRSLLADLHDFIDFDDADIDTARTCLRLHFNEELFLNTVGAWSFRPNTKTRLQNLFVAGDYCRSQADLTSMESTVQSAIRTAGHVWRMLGLPAARTPTPRCIPKYPRWFTGLLWWLGFPIIIPIWGLAKWKEHIHGGPGPTPPLCNDD